MYCKHCGKEIDNLASFCPYCGGFQKNSEVGCDNTQQEEKGSVIKGIGVALTLIGVICGVLITIFMTTAGTAFGYDSWNYYYGGGREMSIGIVIFSFVSLIVGVFMLIGVKKK